ncbi:MAG: SipW-dependent-type signal peptide-containing protein [Lachnospiraceae bacterium]|nr:SipW-dependent-type signal peptide-containing protein [Lachnospiraceae bacterium]
MSKKTKIILSIAAAVAVLAIGGVYAYLTYTTSVTNTFTVGNVSATLTEPGWTAAETADPNAHSNIYPGQVFDKDPTVTLGETSSPAVIFIEVCYPNQEAVTIGTDGKKQAAAVTQLFTPGSLNEGWTELTSKSKTDTTAKTITRVYAYNDELDKGESATVFDTVTFANIAEGQSLTSLDVVVKADIIQAGGMAKAGDKYTSAELGDIYDKFVAQNTAAE